MNVDYPLPKASQEHYTRWSNHTVSTGALRGYTVVWVGVPLTCRFKTNLKDYIGPKNVFILKKKSVFAYGLIDSLDQVMRLSKKYYTTCFPGVQIASVPENNLVTIKLTRRQSVEVPYIPAAFLLQKKQKTTRHKRKRTNSSSDTMTMDVEHIDFSAPVPTWHVMNNEQNRNMPYKQHILTLIRSLIEFSDANDHHLFTDPFEGCGTAADLQFDETKVKALKLITSFLYHYCRSEIGCPVQFAMDRGTLQSWTARLHATS